MQPAVNQKQPQREVFPICLFSLSVLFYSGQSIYNTYLNLYLSSEGLSDSQIGFIISVSTLFILLAQLFWGWVSDRVKVKNRILELLYLATAVISLLFYVGSSFWFLLAAVTFFSIFFNPIIPLQDNYALEYLEKSRDKGVLVGPGLHDSGFSPLYWRFLKASSVLACGHRIRKMGNDQFYGFRHGGL